MLSVSRAQSLPAAPSPAAKLAAILVALACLGFAAANIGLMFTDAVRSDTYRRLSSDYPTAFAVMNWMVFGLKLIGAAVALATIRRKPPFARPAVLGVLLWGAFVTLTVYAVGNLLQAIGLATGLTGDPKLVNLWGIGYVTFFVLFAAGFGILAFDHRRRFHTGRRSVVMGAVGAPVLIGVVLFVVPTLLAARGLLPS
jgi:hypothetical protein